MNKKSAYPQGTSGQHPDSDLLQAFLDQSLASGEYEAMENHVASCPSCSQQLMRLKMVGDQLALLPEIPLGKDFSGAIIRQLESEKQLSQGLTWTMVLQAVTAGVILGLVLPVLRFSFSLPGLVLERPDLITEWKIWMASLAGEWIQVWAAIQGSVLQAWSALSSGSSAAESTAALWGLIVLSGLLSFTVNRLLLKNNHDLRYQRK